VEDISGSMFSHDDYSALEDGAALLERTATRGRLLLTGADRRSYLHGLLTNDITALTEGRGCYAALLTPQGRMISDMRVTELGDRVLIDLPASTAGIVRERLADFIFSEDVEVRDISGEVAQHGLYGPRSAEVIVAALALERPEPGGGIAQSTDRLESVPMGAGLEITFGETPIVVLRSDDLGRSGFELFSPAAAAERFVERLLAAGARAIAAEAAEVTRVEAGRPQFGADMDSTTIPLEAGIEDRAISLTKGCYVGQEIIIRVLHRGQGRVARRLVGMIGSGADGPLSAGMTITAHGREVGAITSAVDSPRLKRPIALGYVHRDSAEPGTVLEIATAAASRQVTVVALPFTLPAGE
jgi:folate-binding protein YgfZ